MKNFILVILIFLFSLIYIFIIPPAPTFMHVLFKIIPMLLIIIYAYLNLPIERHRGHHFIMIGLICCMLGDATLDWLTISLSAFLIAHLFYIIAFYQFINFKSKNISILIAFILYGSWIGFNLVKVLLSEGQFFLIPAVIIYIFIIITMCFMAWMTENYYLMMGSTLFIISDSILAWNEFIIPIEFSGLLIMSTYYLAQFAIATSLSHIKTAYKLTVD